MAAGGEVAAQFEVNQQMMDEATKTLATPGNEQAARGVMDSVVNSLQSGDSTAAVQNLIDNAQLFNVDTTNSAAALTTIFSALDIDPSQQQAMVADALTEGIVDPDKMDMQFLLDQGILTTDNAMIPELGLSVSEIEEMVGPDWKDMTVEQIEGELEVKFDDEAERDDIMRELANPNIDPTRKAELNRELQLLGASGQAESEAMAGRGLERVAQANQVVMGDELKSVEDVLSDDAVKTVSNDLMMKMQEDPENAAAILDQWKKDNPGYEAMGDWVKDSIETLGDKEKMFTDASELVEAKNKEATEFVNDNELFGSTEGAKDVLNALGFNTEGFGAMGNDAESNPTYQALTSYKESNPDKFALFQQNLVNMKPEDMEGLQGADIKTIMETLGTKEGMEEFNYLRELNNEMALMNTDSYTSVMSTILPEDHPLHDFTKKPEQAQEYLTGLRKMKDLGVLTPELEQFSALMDADGDGKIDDPSKIAEQIKGMVGDGINLSNFQGKDAKELMSMLDQGVVNIKDIVNEKNAAYDKNELQPWQESVRTGSEGMQDLAAKNTWMKDGKADVGAAYSSHPSRNKWQKALNPGKIGPGTAKKEGAKIFTALTNNPNLFDTMPPYSGGNASGELKDWAVKNLGMSKKWVSLMMRNLMLAGGGKVSASGARGGSVQEGIKALFGADVERANKAQTDYQKYHDAANTKQPTNPWENF
jgi:hypothetical protein